MALTYHEEDGKIVLHHSADVEGVMKDCHARRAAEGAFDKTPDMRLAFRVPEVVMLDIRERFGWDYMNPEHWPLVKKVLLGPEYAAFRATNKRLA